MKFNCFKNPIDSYCEVCLAKTTNKMICEPCLAELPWITEVSPNCQDSLNIDAPNLQRFHFPPCFNRLRTAWHYDGIIQHWINQMKYRQNLVLLKLMTQLFAQKLLPSLKLHQHQDKVILPVPLHPSKIKQRGFNQSSLIAKHLSQYFSINLDLKSLQRTKATKAQTQLPPQERKKNVSNAFKVVRPITYKRAIIIDDVLTTGATINATCEALMASGVEEIEAWVLARTPVKL